MFELIREYECGIYKAYNSGINVHSMKSQPLIYTYMKLKE